MASTEVPKQVPKPVSEQDAPEQETPEQSLPSIIGEGQAPETNQGVLEQSMATTSSAQGDLPNAIARGKMAMGPSTVEPNQEQGQTNTNQAVESVDDVVEEIQGHLQDGRQHVYIYREHGDHYVCHEEISIDEETKRVEQAARRLIGEV
jgi:fructose-1-phosphate kinase PfkB-like protein